MGGSLGKFPSSFSKKLQELGIDESHIQVFAHQGFMSEVFFVKNEENEFIIHKIFLTPEHRKRNYTNLIQILSNYFSITKTPLAPSYLYKKQE